VADFAAWLRPLGPFNFIYSDGDTLFVHSHRRKQDDGNIRPPGLHLLVRSCNEQAVDLTQSGVLLAPVAQELVLVASVPLTDEPWESIDEGEVVRGRCCLIGHSRTTVDLRHDSLNNSGESGLLWNGRHRPFRHSGDRQRRVYAGIGRNGGARLMP
jgi:hypothetical protein